MKHLHTFTQHLHESQTDPNEITREFYYDLVRVEGQPFWEPLTPEEIQSIQSLYDHINQRGVGSITPRQGLHDDKAVKIVLDDLREGYPIIRIGKKSQEAWTLNTQEEINNSLYVDSRFYLFPDLMSLMGLVAAKFGPQVDWAEIK